MLSRIFPKKIWDAYAHILPHPVPARPLFSNGFPSTRTEGQTNLGHCAYVSVTQFDLWYVGWNS
jgi:hypothetical protein